MKKHVKILFSLSLVILLVSLITIYALLQDSDEKGPIKYELGTLEYVVSGEIKDNYLYPGINLVTENYTIVNNSNIQTEIRIKLRFYLKDVWYEVEDFLDFVEIDGFDFNSTLWTKEADYFYYNDDLVGGENITLFTKLILDGYVVKNNFKSEDFKIELVFHAKQKDNVGWEDLGTKLIN